MDLQNDANSDWDKNSRYCECYCRNHKRKVDCALMSGLGCNLRKLNYEPKNMKALKRKWRSTTGPMWNQEADVAAGQMTLVEYMQECVKTESLQEIQIQLLNCACCARHNHRKNAYWVGMRETVAGVREEFTGGRRYITWKANKTAKELYYSI
jgi:hypothetical protein